MKCVILSATYSKYKLPYFKQAAASVLAQTHQDFIWQVVLDGCDPEVYTWCMDTLFYNEGKGDPRVRLWSHPTTHEQRWKGKYRPAVIFNEHMERLTEWHPAAGFCWLSDDDLLHPRYLEIMSKALERHPVVHCGFRVTEERCGEHVTKAVVGSNGIVGKGGRIFHDPLGVLDGGCVMQTAASFKEVHHPPDDPAVPEGWDTAHGCDGLYMRKLADKFGIVGVNETLFTKRQTVRSTHSRPQV